MTMFGTKMEKLQSHMDNHTHQMEEAAKKQREADMAKFKALRTKISKKVASSPPVDNVKIPASTMMNLPPKHMPLLLAQALIPQPAPKPVHPNCQLTPLAKPHLPLHPRSVNNSLTHPHPTAESPLN
jgi:hypothetical protein